LEKRHVHPLDGNQRQRKMVEPLDVPFRHQPINAFEAITWPPYLLAHRGDELVPLRIVREPAQTMLSNHALNLATFFGVASALSVGKGGIHSLPNVRSQTRIALARNVRLGAHSVTVRFVVCSEWLGSVFISYRADSFACN